MAKYFITNYFSVDNYSVFRKKSLKSIKIEVLEYRKHRDNKSSYIGFNFFCVFF